MSENNDLLEVAKLGRTVGLKGALKLYNLSDFATQFKAGAKFCLKDGRELEIKSFEPSSSLVIFKGFESVESAGELVNFLLYRSVEDTRKYCKLSKNEYFYFDIIGCEVFENAEQGELCLGRVGDIMEVGSGFLLELETDEKLVSQGLAAKFFIPYNDHFTLSVDIKAKKIIAQNSLAILENS